MHRLILSSNVIRSVDLSESGIFWFLLLFWRKHYSNSCLPPVEKLYKLQKQLSNVRDEALIKFRLLFSDVSSTLGPGKKCSEDFCSKKSGRPHLKNPFVRTRHPPPCLRTSWSNGNLSKVFVFGLVEIDFLGDGDATGPVPRGGGVEELYGRPNSRATPQGSVALTNVSPPHRDGAIPAPLTSSGRNGEETIPKGPTIQSPRIDVFFYSNGLFAVRT